MQNYTVGKLIEDAQSASYYHKEETGNILPTLILLTKKSWYVRESSQPGQVSVGYIDSRQKELAISRINFSSLKLAINNFEEFADYVHDKILKIKPELSPASDLLFQNPYSFSKVLRDVTFNNNEMVEGYIVYVMYFGDIVALLKENNFTKDLLRTLKSPLNFNNRFIHCNAEGVLKAIMPKLRQSLEQVFLAIVPVSIEKKILDNQMNEVNEVKTYNLNKSNLSTIEFQKGRETFILPNLRFFKEDSLINYNFAENIKFITPSSMKTDSSPLPPRIYT